MLYEVITVLLMTIEKLLEEKIGLSIPAIGPAVLERVIRARMAACGFSDPEDWLASYNFV